jgi:hypothetical protein
MKRFTAFFLSLFLLAFVDGYAKDIYVSLSGKDNNKGTPVSPFASLHRAQIEARKFKAEPVNILLRGGVYYLTQALVFTAADSRRQAAPLTIKAYGQERVFVRGSAKLSLKWLKTDGTEGVESVDGFNGLYRAKVLDPKLIFDQLYVNGVLMQMARYPNYKAGNVIFNGTAADVLSKDHIQKWKNPEGAYFRVMQAHMWGDFAYRVTGKNAAGTELLMEGGWQNNRPSAMHKDYRFIENVKEELDTLNEWYYDHSSQQLYLKSNADLSTALIESPQVESLLEVLGTAASPVQYINVEGIAFNHNLRTFMKNREPLLRSDWTIYRKGAVTITGAEHIHIKGCEFSEMGGNVLVYSNYNKHHLFSGNHIYHAGGNALVYLGDPKAVRSPSFSYENFVPYADMDLQKGPIGNNFPSACTAYDNLIHDIGQVEKQTAGVQISMAQYITISHNTIYNVPRAGININEGTWGGHQIEFNDVFNTVLETGDHGAFNSWGRDRFWHPNRASMDTLVAKHPELIFLDAVKPTVLFNNRFRCDHGWDIDLDDGSSNYIIRNNVCLNGGLKLREGFNRVVENNIIINNSFHPHVWFKNSNDVFKYNILGAGYFPIRVDFWGENIDHNFFPDQASLKKAQASGTDLHSIAGVPQFMDAAKGDYRLQKGAKAFETGFNNFEMNFGVVSPQLIKKAKKVTLPTIQQLQSKADATYEFAGVQVKNLTTLGERSATGMASETGVLVLRVKSDSPMNGVLKANDVILQMGGQPVATIPDLIKARESSKFKTSEVLRIFRDQREQEVTVKLK